MTNGPELWDEILKQMPLGSVIAGGAVRDYLLGVEPKDIDVFMGDGPYEAPPTQERFFMEAFDARCGLYRIDGICERQEEYAAMTNITLVSTGTLFDHRVDAVVIDNFRDGFNLVRDFDFGVNWCWYAEGETHETRQSREDMANKTVTLLHNDRRERSLRRFQRFNERMGGDWRLIDTFAQAEAA